MIINVSYSLLLNMNFFVLPIFDNGQICFSFIQLLECNFSCIAMFDFFCYNYVYILLSKAR